MDKRFGLVLEKLRAEGRADDTVIIFFGDNGRLEPRGIHWCYDSGLRVPLIIRWPKNFPAPARYAPGTVNDEMVSLLDLTATTADLGKRAGKDAAAGKATMPSLLGVEEARRRADDYCDEALQAFAGLGERAEALRALARFVVSRRK